MLTPSAIINVIVAKGEDASLRSVLYFQLVLGSRASQVLFDDVMTDKRRTRSGSLTCSLSDRLRFSDG